MPYLARYRFHLCDGLRRGSRGNGALQLHARLQIVDCESRPLHRNLRGVGNIGKIPCLAIVHLHYQIVPRNIDDFATTPSPWSRGDPNNSPAKSTTSDQLRGAVALGDREGLSDNELRFYCQCLQSNASELTHMILEPATASRRSKKP